MSVPDAVREQLKARLRELADQIGWMSLSTSAKSKRYEDWARDSAIGGVLARYIDRGQVRLYLKDTLLKDYARHRLADESQPFRVLRIPQETEASERHIKPHGRTLKDGRVICWGRADDWKSVLMAVFERAYAKKGSRPFAAVLMHSAGRFHEEHVRTMVNAAAKNLGIERIIWLDT